MGKYVEVYLDAGDLDPEDVLDAACYIVEAQRKKPEAERDGRLADYIARLAEAFAVEPDDLPPPSTAAKVRTLEEAWQAVAPAQPQADREG